MTKLETKVVKMENILRNTSAATTDETKTQSQKPRNQRKEPKEVIPRGKPKSGRIWKNEKKKFSTIIKTKGIKSSFDQKESLRQKLQRAKEASRSIKAAKLDEKEKQKERRRENLKRQEENKRRSEVVQVITNTKKLKKMKKKQLRMIEKRDTTVVQNNEVAG